MKFEFTSPALVRTSSRKGGGGTPVLCQVPVTVDVREATTDDAPVVLRAEGYLPRRCMDGTFYVSAGSAATYALERNRGSFSEHSGFEHEALASIAGSLIDPDSGKWVGASGMRPAGSPAYLQLALGSRYSGKTMLDFVYSTLRDGPPELPSISDLSGAREEDVQRWTEDAEARVSRMIVIGGQLWKPTPEPMLELRSGRMGMRARVTEATYDGRHSAPPPYGKLNMRAHRGFSFYWWPNVDYFDVNDVATFSARVAEEAAESDLRGQLVGEEKRLSETLDIRDPSVFGIGTGALAADRAARVAVYWAVDEMGRGNVSALLRAKVPEAFKASIGKVFEITRSSDPANGLSSELASELETLAAVMRYHANELDGLKGGAGASIVRLIDNALVRWDRDQVHIGTPDLGHPAP